MFSFITNNMKLTVESIKNKVEEFLKSHPDCRDFLQDIIKEAEEEINKEKNDYEKGVVFEKAKDFCACDVSNFKNSVLSGFKYKLELLKTNDPDYELLENSIKFDDNFENSRYQLDIRNKIKGLKIYRVVSNDIIAKESRDSNQILLLHGTKAQNVEGILKTGFNPSKKGSYGPGVYLTNSFDYAYNYSKSYATEENVIKNFRHFFVNSVPNPEICQDNKQYQNKISFENYLRNEPSLKMYSDSRIKFPKIEDSQKDLHDSYNRKIINGSFQNVDQQKIALAHHSLVVPAYLIEIEEKTYMDDIVYYILYKCLKIGFYTKNRISYMLNRVTYKEKNATNEVSELVFTMIAENLKKEINRNHHAKIDSLTTTLENKTNSIIMKKKLEDKALEISSHRIYNEIFLKYLN